MKTHNTQQPTTIPTLEKMIASGSFGLVLELDNKAVKVSGCKDSKRTDWNCPKCESHETEVETER